MKLLIADQSDIIRSTLTELLMKIPGVEIVGGASNSGDIFQLIYNRHPDLLVMDIKFQETNGIEVIREINNNGNHPKVIVFTSYSFPQYRKECIKAGADYFLDKTTDFNELVQLIRSQINETLQKQQIN